jgi:DivIVA domain-containing protein
MGSFLLVLAVVLVVAALVFGVVALISGEDPGLANAEPDERAIPLPTDRPLAESDLVDVRFDTGLRGYRMDQVDRALRRTAYDLGYKEEMIGVLEAEVSALREGRAEEAERLRRARLDSTTGRDPAGGRAAEPAVTAREVTARETAEIGTDDGHRARD